MAAEEEAVPPVGAGRMSDIESTGESELLPDSGLPAGSESDCEGEAISLSVEEAEGASLVGEEAAGESAAAEEAAPVVTESALPLAPEKSSTAGPGQVNF